MSLQPQLITKGKLIQIRDYITSHLNPNYLAAGLEGRNAHQGTMSLNIDGNGLTHSVITGSVSNHPTSFIVLLDERGRVRLSADIQILVYHLYLLAHRHAVAAGPVAKKWIKEEWLRHYTELAQMEELGDDALVILNDVLGGSVDSMIK
jgi:hypothetical protein